MEPQTFRHGKIQNLKANTFTKNGCKFAGWSTSPTGKAMYKNQEEYMPKKDTTLYAIWKTGMYTVTTISNEGTKLEGNFDNICSICGGRDHECQIITITINGQKAKVVEGEAGLPTIITHGKGAKIEGNYTNEKCSICGGKDHNCEVVNINLNR